MQRDGERARFAGGGRRPVVQPAGADGSHQAILPFRQPPGGGTTTGAGGTVAFALDPASARRRGRSRASLSGASGDADFRDPSPGLA